MFSTNYRFTASSIKILKPKQSLEEKNLEDYTIRYQSQKIILIKTVVQL